MVQLLTAKKLQQCLHWLWRSMHLFKALGVFVGFQGFIGLSPMHTEITTSVNQRWERTQRK